MIYLALNICVKIRIKIHIKSVTYNNIFKILLNARALQIKQL